MLKNIDAPQLQVFVTDGTTNEEIEPYDPIPTDTTGQNPLFVIAPLQQEHTNQWYLVTGVLQRPRYCAGDRFKLVQLARGGYYPQNGRMDNAFKCREHPMETELGLISVAVVFIDENGANHFIADVHSHVAKSPGVILFEDKDLKCTLIDPFSPKQLVLETHYKPREQDGEAPLDSPVWDVELQSIDASDVTYCHSVYKYQNVEEKITMLQ